MTASAPVNSEFGFESWVFRVRKGPIISQAVVSEWSAELKLRSLPEITFDNELSIENPNLGVRLSFSSRGALGAVQRVPDSQQIKVASARQWGARTDHSNVRLEEVHADHDWTFTTLYGGEASVPGRPAGPVAALTEEVASPRIDIARLKALDPIVHYDEVLLYSDELHDNGLSAISVKLRVMPTFFFVLCRYWLRVDGVLFRVHDTRHYHEFGSGCIVVETTRREDSLRAVAMANPKTDVARAPDPASFADSIQVRLSSNAALKWV